MTFAFCLGSFFNRPPNSSANAARSTGVCSVIAPSLGVETSVSGADGSGDGAGSPRGAAPLAVSGAGRRSAPCGSNTFILSRMLGAAPLAVSRGAASSSSDGCPAGLALDGVGSPRGAAPLAVSGAGRSVAPLAISGSRGVALV